MEIIYSNWYQKAFKKKLIQKHRKELRGDTKVDLLIDSAGDVYLKGNKSGVIVKTDLNVN